MHRDNKVLFINVKFKGDTTPSNAIVEKYVRRGMWGTGRGTEANDFGLENVFGYTHYAKTSVVASWEQISRNKVRFPENEAEFYVHTFDGTAASYQGSYGSGICRYMDVHNTVHALLVDNGATNMANGYGEAWMRGFTHVQYILPHAMGATGTVGTSGAGPCTWAGKGRLPMDSGASSINDNDYPIILWMRSLVTKTDTKTPRLDLAHWMRSDWHEIGHNLGFRHSMTTTREYGDVTCRMGASNRYELNAPKAMYGGYLDSDEIADFRDKQTSEHTAGTLVLADITGTVAGTKVIVLGRAVELPFIADFAEDGKAEYTTSDEAVYFVSLHGRTGKVMVHYAPSRRGIAGYMSSGSVVAQNGMLGQGNSFTDAVTGFTLYVKSIQGVSGNAGIKATVSLVFTKSFTEMDQCVMKTAGGKCNGNSPLPSVCAAGRCQVVSPHVKCGRFLDLATNNGFPSYLVGRYTRSECEDDSCLYNGRAQYVHEGGKYRLCSAEDGYWILNKASYTETETGRYARLVKTESTNLADKSNYYKLTDLRTLADPDTVAYWVYFKHYTTVAAGGYTSTAVATMPFCRDNDCDDVGARHTGGYDCSDDDKACHGCPSDPDCLKTPWSTKCWNWQEGSLTCDSSSASNPCQRDEAKEGDSCAATPSTGIAMCSAASACLTADTGTDACGVRLMTTGLTSTTFNAEWVRTDTLCGGRPSYSRVATWGTQYSIIWAVGYNRWQISKSSSCNEAYPSTFSKFIEISKMVGKVYDATMMPGAGTWSTYSSGAYMVTGVTKVLDASGNSCSVAFPSDESGRVCPTTPTTPASTTSTTTTITTMTTRFAWVPYSKGVCNAGHSAIKTKEECEAAAIYLKLGDITAEDVLQVDRPYGCYYSSEPPVYVFGAFLGGGQSFTS